MPLRITPSVAEQEGQQTETEATGAPQKHHYTLNQQVGSITNTCKKITNKLVTVINNRISSAGKYKVSVCDASGILGHYAGR
ncbi:hypothetical protein EX353_12955 [Klebsiella pneumoniae]|nr:hypothetical protein EXC92_14000 [Klebsiella pneumoniae]QBG01956.1 hypothetical protein EX353_12955 [Klebsiella pneumoniae]